MSLSPQQSSSEEPEQQPVVHSAEETLTQPALTAEAKEEESEQTTTHKVEPDAVDTIEQPKEITAEESANEETVPLTAPVATEETANEETVPLTPPATAEEDIQTQVVPPLEPDTTTPDEYETFGSNEENEKTEVEEAVAEEHSTAMYGESGVINPDQETLEEEEEFADDERPAKTGVFIQRGVLIGAACAVVVIALVAALLVFLLSPKDPPTDWIATINAPASATSSGGKVLYYIHWTNKDGQLTGQMQLAANIGGTPTTLSGPATGLYSKTNHIIYIVITIQGQPATLTGKINDNNDTLTLSSPGASSAGNAFVFHTGSSDDYNKAAKKIVAASK